MAMDMSVYDLGYVLGKNPQTVWYWERGRSFPASIVLLKKLEVLYRETPHVLKDIAKRAEIQPTAEEWSRFEKEVYEKTGDLFHSRQNPFYESKDQRDMEYKEAFGEYLMRERMKREIRHGALANALGVSRNAYCQWEDGITFPQDAMVLVLLDKLYGNTFDVLFGLCRENGISLKDGEKRDVLRKMREVERVGRWARGKGSISEKTMEYLRKWREAKKMKKGVSDSFFRALGILEKRGLVTMREFARSMWPDSEAWSRRGEERRFGRGVVMLSGKKQMDIVSCGIWGSLRKKGWVLVSDGKCRISEEGRERLKDARRKRARLEEQ